MSEEEPVGTDLLLWAPDELPATAETFEAIGRQPVERVAQFARRMDKAQRLGVGAWLANRRLESEGGAWSAELSSYAQGFGHAAVTLQRWMSDAATHFDIELPKRGTGRPRKPRDIKRHLDGSGDDHAATWRDGDQVLERLVQRFERPAVRDKLRQWTRRLVPDDDVQAEVDYWLAEAAKVRRASAITTNGTEVAPDTEVAAVENGEAVLRCPPHDWEQRKGSGVMPVKYVCQHCELVTPNRPGDYRPPGVRKRARGARR